MKKSVFILFFSFLFSAAAQNYTFTRSTGTYVPLTGNTLLENADWDYFERGVKLPFTFTYWGTDYTDSVYVDAAGSISIDDNINQEIVYFGEDLISRGAGRSPVSYAVEGTSPGRILKIEFRNAGINNDTALADSVNVQCWIYETTHVLEFHYGPGRVKPANWSETGIYAGIVNANMTKYIILEGNPLNPVQNSSNLNQALTLNGMPADGTVYRFTPGNGSAIRSQGIKINIAGGQILLPPSVQVSEAKLYNMTGQLLQSVHDVKDIQYEQLNTGLYLLVLDTDQGTMSGKLLR